MVMTAGNVFLLLGYHSVNMMLFMNGVWSYFAGEKRLVWQLRIKLRFYRRYS